VTSEGLLNYRGKQFAESQHPHSKLELADFTEADLTEANLSNLTMRSATLFQARMDRTNLTQASLCHINFGSATMEGSQLRGAHVSGTSRFYYTLASLSNLALAVFDQLVDVLFTDFTYCQATEIKFDVVRCLGTRFSHSMMAGGSLESFELLECELIETDLREASIRKGRIEACDFSGADLRGATIDMVRWNKASSFTGAKIGGANIQRDLRDHAIATGAIT